jgi:hypothetical protein
MNKLNKSPERGTFQRESYIKRTLEKGKEPRQDYIDMWKNMDEQKEQQEQSQEWRENNLEYDLRSNPWICDKVKASEVYAQNLYAALCNQVWQRQEVWQVLKNQTWSCSWRYAGGIIADMREQGDYLDWYCSGIGSHESGYGLAGRKPVLDDDGGDYVAEGIATEEIIEDLLKLGWSPVDDPDADKMS